MKRGEVRWYVFSRPDKKRPVLVLTRDSALEFLGEVTVAPITTTVRDIPWEFPRRRGDGMPRIGAVNPINLKPVWAGGFGSWLMRWTKGKLDQFQQRQFFAW